MIKENYLSYPEAVKEAVQPGYKLDEVEEAQEEDEVSPK